MDVTKPPNFLDIPGEPVIEFEHWLKCFRNYVIAMGGESFSDERLKALLLNGLGVEGQRQFKALERVPPSVPTDAQAAKPLYSEAIQKLRDRFVKKKSTVTIRAEFRSRRQRVGESVADFVKV